MGNLQSAPNIRPRRTFFDFLLHPLVPSFAGGEGGGGGSDKNTTINNPYLNDATKRLASNKTTPAAANDNGGGSAKSFDGRASSTKKGHDGAIKKWNAFAAKNNYPQFDMLTQSYVCGTVYANDSMANPRHPPIVELMEEFAQFLVDYEKNPGEEDDVDDDGENELEMLFSSTGREEYNGLAPGSILGHFTRLKSRLFKRFQPLGFQGDMPDWYGNLHRSLKNRVVSACIARGGTVSKKTVGIGRKALANMCEYFFGQNTAMGYEKRCVLAVVFAAVGRGGEISFTQWDGVRWNVDREHLVMDWGEVKKGVQYLMTFHPDATNWRIDVLHAIACYVLCGHGGAKASTTQQESGVNWIFPGYVDLADGGAASKLSRVVEEAKDANVADLLKASTSHGLRVGASDEMVYHYLLSVFAAISRGGWDCKADSMLFHYLTADSSIDQAGKALANWHDPRMHVSAPTLDAFRTSENEHIVEAFCRELLGTSCIPNVNTEMKAVRDVLVASLLRFYDDIMEADRNSLVIRKIQAAALRTGMITLDELRQWGLLVKNRFLVANAQNLGNNGGTDAERFSTALTALQECCAQMSAQLVRSESNQRQLLVGQNKMAAQLDRMESNQGSILKNQQNMEDWMDTSTHFSAQLSPLKRKTSSMDSPPKKAAAGNAPDDASATTKKAKAAAAGNALEETMSTKAVVKWRECGQWTCDALIEELLKSNMDVNSVHFIPLNASDDSRTKKGTVRKKRLNARNVFKELFALANDEQKGYFDPKNLPSGDLSVVRNKWLLEMKNVVEGLAILLAKHQIRTILEAEGNLNEQSFKKKFNSTTLKVGRLGNLMGEALTAVNKANEKKTS